MPVASAIVPSPGGSACRRGPIVWDDLFQGRTAIDPSRIGGDFLVARQTVGPSYQLAVVVDDAAMGVNQVDPGSGPRDQYAASDPALPEPRMA